VTPLALAIIQAREHSTRLPGKMTKDLGGHSVIWHAWSTACAVFGPDVVVVAIPAADVHAPLGAELRSIGATIFAYTGDERDVLGRLYACARLWQAQAIVRITPDDFPIDVTRERFSFAWLEAMHETVTDPIVREHVGLLLPGRIEINTQADLESARKLYA
jgi:hypothetical protein